MRRLDLIQTVVQCPHVRRPVTATRNLAIDKLVACDENEKCRDPNDPQKPFPHACAVYTSLAK